MTFSTNITTHPTATLLSTLQSYIPTALHPFLTLSYPIPPPVHTFFTSISSTRSLPPTETLYEKGFDDIYFVAFCALAFTLLREVVVRWVFSSFARNLLERNVLGKMGKGSRISRRERRKIEHTATRFAEQGWSFMYCTIFWTLGMVILNRLPNPTSPETLWGTYPVIRLRALSKFYYLAQLGWWWHQIYVINSEKRRKDHWQMFAHHCLSIALITSSYVLNFTTVGTLVHVLMDFCDILFPLAKMLRYLSMRTACDLTFIIFLLSWLVSRQIGLFLVIKTTYYDAPRFIKWGWNSSKGYYWTRTTYTAFLTMQITLFCLATVWFYMACMVAIRVVQGLGAEDSRSDGEDEDGESPLEDVPQLHSVGDHTGSNGLGNAIEKRHGNGTGKMNGHVQGYAKGVGCANGNGHENGHVDGNGHGNENGNGHGHGDEGLKRRK